MADPLENLSIGVLLEDLFEDLELWYPVIRLREAGARVVLLGTGAADYRGLSRRLGTHLCRHRARAPGDVGAVHSG